MSAPSTSNHSSHSSNSTAKLKFLWKILLLLAAVNAALALYLIHDHYQLANGTLGYESFCSAAALPGWLSQCEKVNGSGYSEIFGIPLASLGLAQNVVVIVSVALAWTSPFWIRPVLLWLSLVMGASFLGSVSLFFISFFIIKAFCLLCLITYVLNGGILFGVLLAFRTWSSKSWREEWGKLDRSLGQRLVLGSLVVSGATLAFTVDWRPSSQNGEERGVPSTENIDQWWRDQPRVEISPSQSPRLGTNTPVLHLVEFSDFQCPHCAIQAQKLKQILQRFGDRVAITFKNFPLDNACNPLLKGPMHPVACLAAKAALCADQQGKFKHAEEFLFAHQKDLSLETIQALPQKLGLKDDAFSSCLIAPETQAAVRNEIQEGIRLGVQGTPSIFINGKKFDGLVSPFVVEHLLKK